MTLEWRIINDYLDAECVDDFLFEELPGPKSDWDNNNFVYKAALFYTVDCPDVTDHNHEIDCSFYICDSFFIWKDDKIYKIFLNFQSDFEKFVVCEKKCMCPRGFGQYPYDYQLFTSIDCCCTDNFVEGAVKRFVHDMFVHMVANNQIFADHNCCVTIFCRGNFLDDLICYPYGHDVQFCFCNYFSNFTFMVNANITWHMFDSFINPPFDIPEDAIDLPCR